MFNVATYGNIDGTGTASPTVLANPTAYALMAQYLNLPYFCDYIIVNYYAGNWDWDCHNYSALYSPGLGFVFQDWDGERMLLSGWNSNPSNITSHDTPGDPTQLFVQLMANPDFRQMFADHVYKDLSTVLSPTNAAAMYQKVANTISTAVLDESARWGNLGELDGTWDRTGHARHLGRPDQHGTRLVVPHADGHDVHPVRDGRELHTPPAATSRRHLHDVSEHLPARAVRQRDGGERRDVHARRRAHHDDAATAGTIYYTTDGSDPRASSSGFTVASITLSGTTATVTLDDADTGLSNGEEIYIGGASQTAYDGSSPSAT